MNFKSSVFSSKTLSSIKRDLVVPLYPSYIYIYVLQASPKI